MAIRDPRDIPGLVVWYSAESVVGLSDQTDLTQWNDLSGNGNHAIATSATRKPQWRGGSGDQSIWFGNAFGPGETVGIDDAYYELPANLMSGWTSGEMIAYLEPTGTGVADGIVSPWSLGQDTGPNDQSYLDYTNVRMGEHFGLATGQRVEVDSGGRDHIYHIWSAPGDWAVRVGSLNPLYPDPITIMSKTDGTVAWPGTALLGAGRRGGTGQIGPGTVDKRYVGEIGSFILYNRKLTDDERADLWAWFRRHPAGGTTTRRVSAAGLSLAEWQSTANQPEYITLGAPSGTRAGDLMLAYITYTGSVPASSTPPTGWTLLKRQTVGSNRLMEIYSREATSPEPQSHTWDLGTSTTNSNFSTGAIVSYRDVRVVASSIAGEVETTGSNVESHPAATLNVPSAIGNATLVQFAACRYQGYFTWNNGVPIGGGNYDDRSYIAERSLSSVAGPTFTPGAISHSLDGGGSYAHEWITAAVLLEHTNHRMWASLSAPSSLSATIKPVGLMRSGLSSDLAMSARSSEIHRVLLSGSGTLTATALTYRRLGRESAKGLVTPNTPSRRVGWESAKGLVTPNTPSRRVGRESAKGLVTPDNPPRRAGRASVKALIRLTPTFEIPPATVTVSATNPQLLVLLEVPAGEVTVRSLAVSMQLRVYPAAGNVTITAPAPLVIAHQEITTPSSLIALNAPAPTLSQRIGPLPAGEVGLSAPTPSQRLLVVAPTGQITITSTVPSTVMHQKMATPSGSIVLSAPVPMLNQIIGPVPVGEIAVLAPEPTPRLLIVAPTGVITITSTVPGADLRFNLNADVPADDLTVSTPVPRLRVPQPVSFNVPVGAVTVRGIAPVLNATQLFDVPLPGEIRVSARRPVRIYQHGLVPIPTGVEFTVSLTSDFFRVTGNTEYQLGADVKSDGTMTDAALRIDWYDGSQAFIESSRVVTGILDVTPIRLSIETVSPATAQWARVVVGNGYYGVTAGDRLWVDNVTTHDSAPTPDYVHTEPALTQPDVTRFWGEAYSSDELRAFRAGDAEDYVSYAPYTSTSEDELIDELVPAQLRRELVAQVLGPRSVEIEGTAPEPDDVYTTDVFEDFTVDLAPRDPRAIDESLISEPGSGEPEPEEEIEPGEPIDPNVQQDLLETPSTVDYPDTTDADESLVPNFSFESVVEDSTTSQQLREISPLPSNIFYDTPYDRYHEPGIAFSNGLVGLQSGAMLDVIRLNENGLTGRTQIDVYETHGPSYILYSGFLHRLDDTRAIILSREGRDLHGALVDVSGDTPRLGPVVTLVAGAEDEQFAAWWKPTATWLRPGADGRPRVHTVVWQPYPYPNDTIWLVSTGLQDNVLGNGGSTKTQLGPAGTWLAGGGYPRDANSFWVIERQSREGGVTYNSHRLRVYDYSGQLLARSATTTRDDWNGGYYPRESGSTVATWRDDGTLLVCVSQETAHADYDRESRVTVHVASYANGAITLSPGVQIAHTSSREATEAHNVTRVAPGLYVVDVVRTVTPPEVTGGTASKEHAAVFINDANEVVDELRTPASDPSQQSQGQATVMGSESYGLMYDNIYTDQGYLPRYYFIRPVEAEPVEERTPTHWIAVNGELYQDTVWKSEANASGRLESTVTSLSRLASYVQSGLVTVDADTDYIVGADVRGNGTIPTASLRVDWLNAAGDVVGSMGPVTTTLTESPSRLTVEGATPSNAVNAHVIIGNGPDGTAVGASLWIDNVTFVTDELTELMSDAEEPLTQPGETRTWGEAYSSDELREFKPYDEGSET